MNVALARKRHESFCLHYMSTMNGSQAALAAGYSARNPKNAHIIAWTLLKREDVQARLKELRKAMADEAIMSVIERKRRLSQIARASYDDPDRAGDPIAAIHQLNLMDGVYRNKGEVAAPGGSSTVVVVEDARTKLAAVMNKLPVRTAEAKDVPLLGEGKKEKAPG
jgi:phage terminase small subunit